MVHLIAHHSVLWGDLWVNKVSASLLQQLELKNKYKPLVQLYRFGVNGLIRRNERLGFKVCHMETS